MHLPHLDAHILSLAGLSQLSQVNKVPRGAKDLPGPGAAALAAVPWHSWLPAETGLFSIGAALGGRGTGFPSISTSIQTFIAGQLTLHSLLPQANLLV